MTAARHASGTAPSPREGTRLVAVAAMLAVLVAVAATLVPQQAVAQEAPRTLFELLFPGSRQPQRREEPPPTASKPRQQPAARRAAPRAAATSPAVTSAAPEATVVSKNDDARVLLVVGDFLGGGLAEGLATVFADDATVRVVDRTNGSSGFVRDDYYDWPGEIAAILDETTPTAVAVMMGSNDRQQMRVGDSREAPRSDRWNEEYARRVTAFATKIGERKIPFVWVSLPSFKSSRMSSDMLAFNDIQRGAAEAAGAAFVDIWEGFVDENGAFVTTGPDVNGQPVRLRASDGINFTQSGKRKIAFYAEKPLNRILESGQAGQIGMPASLPPPQAVSPIGTPDAGEQPPIDRTLPISLFDPAIDGGDELLGFVTAPKRDDPRTPAERLSIEGLAPEPVAGRVDDFSLPGDQAPSGGTNEAGAQPKNGNGTEKTSAIDR